MSDAIDSMAALDDDSVMLAAISEDALAETFTQRHRHTARFCAAWGRWLLWNGKRWEIDEKLRSFDLARETCRAVLKDRLTTLTDLTEAQRARLRLRLGSAQTIAAVLRIASASPVHAIGVDQLDADPWALNTPGGELDLRTGTLRAPDPYRLQTKITAAAPAAEAQHFLRTLERVLPDPDVRRYVQRLAGYCLTGLVRDHVLPFWYGAGRNGKSVVVNAIKHALGDYALTLNPEVLMESRNDRHPTEVAVLRGARLAVASEVDSGRQWNESRLKRLTGGDPITARFIARDAFEFLPSHKLVVVANSKPGLRVVDDAIRGRIHLVSFGVTIPEAERDETLPEKLRGEAAGILGWALAGCLEWQRIGLAPPEAVRAATAGYFESEDTIAQWITDCCRPVGEITLTAAHRAYREWCDANAVHPIGRNQFGDQLEARGHRRIEKVRRHWVFTGLSLHVPAEVRYAD
jgi:P4 family phage/plasmid primase-like protien